MKEFKAQWVKELRELKASVEALRLRERAL